MVKSRKQKIAEKRIKIKAKPEKTTVGKLQSQIAELLVRVEELEAR